MCDSVCVCMCVKFIVLILFKNGVMGHRRGITSIPENCTR